MTTGELIAESAADALGDIDLALEVRVKNIKHKFGIKGAWKIISMIDKTFPGCSGK